MHFTCILVICDAHKYREFGVGPQSHQRSLVSKVDFPEGAGTFLINVDNYVQKSDDVITTHGRRFRENPVQPGSKAQESARGPGPPCSSSTGSRTH